MTEHLQYLRWLVSALLVCAPLLAQEISEAAPGVLQRQPYQLAPLLKHRSDKNEQVSAKFSPAVSLSYEHLKPEEYESQIYGTNLQPPSVEFYQLSPPAKPSSYNNIQPFKDDQWHLHPSNNKYAPLAQHQIANKPIDSSSRLSPLLKYYLPYTHASATQHGSPAQHQVAYSPISSRLSSLLQPKFNGQEQVGAKFIPPVSLTHENWRLENYKPYNNIQAIDDQSHMKYLSYTPASTQYVPQAHYRTVHKPIWSSSRLSSPHEYYFSYTPAGTEYVLPRTHYRIAHKPVDSSSQWLPGDEHDQINAKFIPSVFSTYENLKPEESETETDESDLPANEEIHQLSSLAKPSLFNTIQAADDDQLHMHTLSQTPAASQYAPPAHHHVIHQPIESSSRRISPMEYYFSYNPARTEIVLPAAHYQIAHKPIESSFKLSSLLKYRGNEYEQTSAKLMPEMSWNYRTVKPEEDESQIDGSDVGPASLEIYQPSSSDKLPWYSNIRAAGDDQPHMQTLSYIPAATHYDATPVHHHIAHKPIASSSRISSPLEYYFSYTPASSEYVLPAAQYRIAHKPIEGSSQLPPLPKYRGDIYQQTSAQFSPAVPLTYENLKPEEYDNQIYGSNIQPISVDVYQLSPPVKPSPYYNVQPTTYDQSHMPPLTYTTPASTQYAPPARYPMKNSVPVPYEAVPMSGVPYGYSYSYPSLKSGDGSMTPASIHHPTTLHQSEHGSPEWSQSSFATKPLQNQNWYPQSQYSSASPLSLENLKPVESESNARGTGHYGTVSIPPAKFWIKRKIHSKDPKPAGAVPEDSEMKPAPAPQMEHMPYHLNVHVKSADSDMLDMPDQETDPIKSTENTVPAMGDKPDQLDVTDEKADPEMQDMPDHHHVQTRSASRQIENIPDHVDTPIKLAERAAPYPSEGSTEQPYQHAPAIHAVPPSFYDKE